MAQRIKEDLQKLVVAEGPDGMSVEEFVGSTLKFKRNGMTLPDRAFTDDEIRAMRETWVK